MIDSGTISGRLKQKTLQNGIQRCSAWPSVIKDYKEQYEAFTVWW